MWLLASVRPGVAQEAVSVVPPYRMLLLAGSWSGRKACLTQVFDKNINPHGMLAEELSSIDRPLTAEEALSLCIKCPVSSACNFTLPFAFLQ